MRILYITNDLSEKNGWSTYTTNLMKVSLQDPENSVAVLAQDVNGFDDRRLQKYKAKFEPFNLFWNPINIYLQYKQYQQIVKDFSPDIIHVTIEPFLTPFGIRNIRCPYIVTVHGTYAVLPRTLKNPLKKFISSFYFERGLHKASSIISVSKSTEKRLVSTYPQFRNKIKVVHNSIFCSDSNFKRSMDVSENLPIHVVTVGEVKRRKGVYESIKFLANWSAKHKRHVVYDVVGKYRNDSPYAKKIADLMKEKDTEFLKVKFHGHVSEKEKIEILNQASMYTHLERVDDGRDDVEGFGIGIIEAATYGIPAIVFEGSATAEAVLDGVTGYVLRKSTYTEDINGKISSILVKNEINKKNLDKWVSKHDPKRTYEQISALYKKSVEAKSKYKRIPR